MAACGPTGSVTSRFTKYKGSREETDLKHSLKWLVTAVDFPPPGLFNLVIKYSNAVEGTSFTDAWVYLKIADDRLRNNYTDGRLKCGMVPMNAVLNLPTLKKVGADGVDAIEKCTDSEQEAFLRLLEFLGERRIHENAIKKIVRTTSLANGSKETQVMTVLAHHLFSQLVPGKIYEVDNTKQVPEECSCGCKAKICGGNTSLGSPGTWHGRADIFLNHTIPVVIKQPYIEKDEDEESSDEDEYELKRKQRKVETENSHENESGPVRKQTNIQSCDICVEVKAYKKHDIVLQDQKVLNQIWAEAITNSFAQVNMNRDSLSHFLIPTFGATSEHVTISLYDSENDYFLHIKEPLKLWKSCPNRESVIKVDTIVIIWLFLNFTVFTRKSLHSVIDLQQAGLLKDLEQCLEFYKKAATRVNFVLPTVPFFEDIEPTVLSFSTS